MIVEATLSAIPGIFSVAGLLALMFFVFAVIACHLFGHNHPELFGNITTSVISLFQIMLPDDYAGISQVVEKTSPYCYWFFIPFIIVMTFIILNLFFSLIVSAMQKEAEAVNLAAGLQSPHEEIMNKLKEIDLNLQLLNSTLKSQKEPE